MKHVLARTARVLWRPVLAIWGVIALSRIGLAAWQSERVGAQGAWLDVLAQGLRFDGVALGLVWVLPATLLPLAMLWRRGEAWAAAAVRVYGLSWLMFVFFMEWATPAFIAEYDTRPNYLFVEYLSYMREVGATVFAQYPIRILATLLVLPALGWAYWRFTRAATVGAARSHVPARWTAALPAAAMLFVACALLARGTLGHRPANLALAAVGQDALVNQLAPSSAYTLAYALYQARRSEEGGIAYGKMPESEVVRIVREESGIDPAAFTSPVQPTLHRQGGAPGGAPARGRNLVIILEESLGAEFVARLGGAPVTPNLERLSREGIWFEQLYATGTRSVRGIEAVVAGFPPTSAPSTVKLARSQRGFFTLAQFLRRHGYRSIFYYGGESHFDNMRGFFLGNGFQEAIDERDFPATVFRGTWGVSDEALFDRAHASFLQQDGPFFGLVFTSSNHAPFEFPDGAIELHEQPRATANNAVKYADHALGRFIERARQSPYWDRTVFLVVADHNSRVYGDALVPLKRFHIPGLILGGSIRPDVIDTLASQIDLAPTLISLLGLEGEHPMIGRDLTQRAQRQRTGRAIVQFDKTQAYVEGEDVVVLRPDLPPVPMRYDARTGELRPSDKPLDEALARKAVAHALFASLDYRKDWHRAQPAGR